MTLHLPHNQTVMIYVLPDIVGARIKSLPTLSDKADYLLKN